MLNNIVRSMSGKWFSLTCDDGLPSTTSQYVSTNTLHSSHNVLYHCYKCILIKSGKDSMHHEETQESFYPKKCEKSGKAQIKL